MLTLAILAGGRSNRMGQDKALLPFLGQPLIRHVIEHLSSLADEVLISANDPAAYTFLGFPIVLDLQPAAGPLGGLYSILNAARHPYVAVVACDMPFASLPLFTYEHDFIVETRADVVLPSTSDGLEPLHAVYRRETCLPAVSAALEAKNYKLIDWMSKVDARLIPPEVVARYDPQGLAFSNLNTPEEFARAEQQYRSSEQE